MHVWARLTGHGVTIVPRAPFKIQRVTGTGEVAVFHREMLLLVKGQELEWGRGALAPSDVAEVTEGPPGPWTIDTLPFLVDWPDETALLSRDSPWFDLLGPSGELIFPQGPFSAPPRWEKLVAPGQSERRRGKTATWEWLELGYEHEGERFIQRQYLSVQTARGVFAWTSQSPEARAEWTTGVADQLVASMRVRPPRR